MDVRYAVIMADSWSAEVIETHTGGRFDILKPDANDVRLEDIAAGLAHTCRFGGHFRRFYSVTQHSLYVSRELPVAEPRLQLLGLLHDAGEAYLDDIPARSRPSTTCSSAPKPSISRVPSS